MVHVAYAPYIRTPALRDPIYTDACIEGRHIRDAIAGVQLRLPSGGKLTRSFGAADPVAQLYDWVAWGMVFGRPLLHHLGVP